MRNSLAAATSRGQPKLRCAIYTRKSSEEGLEQEFNSLDAQREACEAYILSQKHEGWGVLPDMYDDGGFSGGTVERPALRRLLADIAAGRIDVVVVYKVDRLTRSLADFAKIVEVFDAKGVSFVSVTQQFNTTSSMGRLTLNVLLSFAQFEREVTGERIRDKIAASKKKGMWMGGLPPLGYEVRDRKLMINEPEAETVRHIFRLYAELQSVRLLRDELAAQSVVSKTRTASDGSAYGGRPLARGALYLMLQNRIYRGEIVHKDQTHPGEHAAIIEEDLWAEVQRIMETNRVDRSQGADADQPSLLVGLIYDAEGRRMTPTHAVTKGKRYRYYVSKSLITDTAKANPGTCRIPAPSIERLIIGRIRAWLSDAKAVLEGVGHNTPSATAQSELIAAASLAAESLDGAYPQEQRKFLQTVVTRVQVHADRVDIQVARKKVAAALGQAASPNDEPSQGYPDYGEPELILSIPARLKRTGIEMRMVIDGAARPPMVDPGLVRLIARAHAIRNKIEQDGSITLAEIARQKRLAASYVTRLIRLTWLAPDITVKILAGQHPAELNARKLMDDNRLPKDWNEQRQVLGFTSE